MNTRILLVEDEETLSQAVKINLELEGYEVACAATGKQALKKFSDQRINMVILDIMLPQLNGYKVCQAIRAKNNDVPILFLTAKDTTEDKIKGFKFGGDDYLTKPFNLEELLLRVKVLVRHSMKGTLKEKNLYTYKFGNNEINFSKLEAKGVRDKNIALTVREAALLKLLIENKNEVVERKEILETVWNYDVHPTTRTIDNYILTFRRYFEINSKRPRHFFSVRGYGYKFTE